MTPEDRAELLRRIEDPDAHLCAHEHELRRHDDFRGQVIVSVHCPAAGELARHAMYVDDPGDYQRQTQAFIDATLTAHDLDVATVALHELLA